MSPRAYRTREDAPAEPRPLRVGDGGMRLLGEHARARVRALRGGAGGPAIPDRKPVRAFHEPELAPGPGDGLLSLAVDGGRTAPVAAVDGVPVAVGVGQLDLVLRAGSHTVEVQGRYTADPFTVRIAPGGAHRLQYFEDEAGHRVLGELPEEYPFVATNAGCLWWFVLVALVCGLPYGAVAWLQPPLVPSAIASVAVSVVLIAVCVPLHRRSQRKHADDVAALRRAAPREPVPYGPGAVLLGTAPSPVPSGSAAIDVHLSCGRHLWAGRRTLHEGTFLSRAWTSPPRVRIDGDEQPAGWGHWRYLVAPGAHEVTVIVDGAPLHLGVPTRQTGEATAQATAVVEAHAGQAVPLEAEAHVYAVWRPASGDVESFTPRLRLGP